MDKRSPSAACSERVVSEVGGKQLLSRYLHGGQGRPDEGLESGARCYCVNVDGHTDWDELVDDNPWLKTQSGLVVKPDQSLKRREQLGLIQLNVDFETAKSWIQAKIGSRIEVDGVETTLKQFLIEPFLPHRQNEEFYLCIYSDTVFKDVVLFHHEGGVDVGNVDEKALRLLVDLEEKPKAPAIEGTLLKNVPQAKRQMLCDFIQALLACFRDLHFTYLEINPLVVTETQIHILDVAAKLDAKAAPLCKEKWGPLKYAPSACRDRHSEELHIAKLSANTPCAMHLTILNRAGRIWSLVAGGGTSLVINDTANVLGIQDEVACYTQFSGRASAEQMYEFTKTLIDLMVEAPPRPESRAFLLSSNVMDLVKALGLKIGPAEGVMRALEERLEKLKTHNISLLIRRPSVTAPKTDVPRALAELGVPIHVFNMDTPMTRILQCALGVDVDKPDGTCITPPSHPTVSRPVESSSVQHAEFDSDAVPEIFNSETKVIVVGLMSQAVQAMLEFDFVCGRKTPSVAAVVMPGQPDKVEHFLWGEGQESIPVYGKMETALGYHPDARVVVNGASGMDAYTCATIALKCNQIQCLLIIAGHIPDQHTRALLQMARNNRVLVIGPCTPKHLMQVNFIMPGCFRCNKFSNIGGSLDDLVCQRLYRPGSVGMVTRSGGLSTELVVHIARNTDGLYRGVSLGGGTYTGSSFMDHLASLEKNPEVKILLLLGEFGGLEEYEVCQALRSGFITKPMIAFCIGECADMFKSEPGYFGHAGASNDVTMETAAAKNKALAEAGAIVPSTFDGISEKLGQVYGRLVSEGKLVPRPEPPVPSIPANMRPKKGKK